MQSSSSSPIPLASYSKKKMSRDLLSLWFNCAECWNHTPLSTKRKQPRPNSCRSTVGCHTAAELQQFFLYWRLCKNSIYQNLGKDILCPFAIFLFSHQLFSAVSQPMCTKFGTNVIPWGEWFLKVRKPGHIGRATLTTFAVSPPAGRSRSNLSMLCHYRPQTYSAKFRTGWTAA